MTKKLRYLCTLLLMMVASGVWADTYTLGWGLATGDEGTFSNFSATSGEVKGLLSYTTAKNAASSNPAINSNQLRLYYASSGNGGSITITPAEGITFTSVVVTSTVNPAVAYSVDGGTAKSINGVSNSGKFTYTISGISATSSLMIQNVNETNTQLRIQTIEITYTGSSSSKENSDLALSESTDLSFDLYNNSDAQVISYSTSSTGEVTVEENDYATFAVDQTNKTITVTPKAVTPNKQTITVTQAEDNNYYKGTSSFSFTVVDSTPFSGGVITFDATVDKGINSQGEASIVSGPVTLASTNCNFGRGDDYRIYKNADMTISTSQGKITKIVFTASEGYPPSNISTETGSYEDGVWEGKESSIKFITGSENQARFTKIVVTVEISNEPEIVVEDVSLTYDQTSGEFTYTINNEPDDYGISVSSDEGWLKIYSGNPISIECEENTGHEARTATVTITLIYDNDEKEVTSTVTVTQAGAPVVYDNIPDMFEAATTIGKTATDVLVKFDGWVVTGVSSNGKTVFVSDGTNGFIIYGAELGFEVGNTLTSSTPISCKLQLFNGSAEITELTASTEGLTVGTGGSVGIADITMANLAGVNTGALVSYKNLTCTVEVNNEKTYYYLSDGTTTLQVYNTLFAFGALEADKKYDITGVYQQYSTNNRETKEILPRSAEDIKEATEEGTISTGINSVEQTIGDAVIYNLNGVRVNKVQKGVYVVNGKKVVIK